MCVYIVSSVLGFFFPVEHLKLLTLGAVVSLIYLNHSMI